MAKPHIQTKRVYDGATKSDGFRVLVDRVWPRGVSRDEAAVDEWLKEVGPSKELRQWFDHQDERFEEFAQRYKKELKDNEAFSQLREIVKEHGKVTLVYSSKNPLNQAKVLQEVL